jgi:hypothetical protein
VFSTDRNKPNPPTLLFHYPTCAELRDIGIAFDAARKEPSLTESIKLRADAIRTILAGWENVRNRTGHIVPFNPADLETILTDTDFTELDARMLRDMANCELEKKRSALLSLSSMDVASSASAPIAPAATATPVT